MSEGRSTSRRTSKWNGKEKEQAEQQLQDAKGQTVDHPPIPEYFVLDENNNERQDGKMRLHMMVAEDGKTIYPLVWSGMSPARALLFMLQSSIELAINAFDGMYKENADLRTQLEGTSAALKMAMERVKL